MKKLSAYLASAVLLLFLITGARASAATLTIDDDNTPSAPDYLTTNYTDDAACIQAAINAAASGDTITIREGDYWISTQVSGSKNLTLVGEGTVNLHIALGSGNPGFYFHGTQVVSKTAFTADALTGAAAVSLTNAAGAATGDLVRISNNTIWSAADDAGLRTGELYVAQSVAGNDVTLTTALIRDYTVANGSTATIYHPVEVHVDNLRFFGAGTAAEVQGLTLEFCKNSSVLNSYFRANGMAAMYLRTCSNVEIGHNEIYDSNMVGFGYGVAPVDAASNINIHDNFIRNCRHGITSGMATNEGVNRGIVITNNTIYRDNGISVPIDAHPTTIDYIVTGNTIYAGYYDLEGNLLFNDEPAFHDGTIYSEFTNNRVYDGIGVKHRGLKAGGTKIVTGNTITGTNAGIFLQFGGDFEKLDIENNYLETNYGTDFYGVNIYNNLTVRELTVSGNTIKNSKNGIYVDITNPTATKVEVQNNTVENSSWNGIQINILSAPPAANIDVSENAVTAAGRNGIWMELDGGDGGSVRNVHNNIVSNIGRATGSYGVRLQGTQYTKVYDNKITDDGSGITNYGVFEENVTVGAVVHYSDYNQVIFNRIMGTRTSTVQAIGANTVVHDNGEIPNDSQGNAFETSSSYSLTVNGGTGSGTYATGATISITAPAPATGKLFSRWSGYTSCLANANAINTTVTMPAIDVFLAPVYVWRSDYVFALTLASGTISGTGSTSASYKPGEIVTIVADAPIVGKVFDRWSGDTEYVANIASATTTVTTVEGATNLTATYRDASSTLYALTVTGGSGTGSYTKGFQATISADTPATGKVFDRWTGYTSYIDSVTSAVTTLTMPPSAVMLTATFKDIATDTYLLTVTNGIGSGLFAAGRTVSIVAAEPAAGTVFDRWTGADGYLSSTVTSAATLTMPSDALTVVAVYKTVTAAPTFSVATGTYYGAQNVTLSTSTEGASIRYTTDGTDPTASSTLYSGALNLSTSTIVKAKAFKADSVDSNISSAAYTILLEGEIPLYVLTVTGGIGSGSHAAGITVAVAANPPAAGKEFDRWTGDVEYLGSATDSATTFTMPSEAAAITAAYKDKCATPVFSVATGTYTGARSVTLVTDTVGASIYYTTNGTLPTASSTLYIGAISVSSATTVKAIAIKENCASSDVAIAVYGFNTVTSSGGGGGGGSTRTIPEVLVAEIVAVEGSTVTLRFNVRDAKWMILSDNSKLSGATWEDLSASKIYTKKEGQTGIYVQFKSSTSGLTSVIELPIVVAATAAPADTAVTDTAAAAMATPPAVGTLIKAPDSIKVYVIIDGKKKWISTPEVFEQLGYQWAGITVVAAEQLNAYPDYEDNLIRQNGDYKVYLVVDGIRRHIPNPEIFLDYGFKWEDVKDVDVATIEKYKSAFLLKQSGQDGIYFIAKGVRKLVPTAAISESYGNKASDIQIVSKAEMESYPITDLVRLGASSDVYLVRGTSKYRIPSVAVFDKYKFDWGRIISINQTEFDYYQDGGELK